MTKEEKWLTEKINQCTTLLEDFNNIYQNQLFYLCNQAISSDTHRFVLEISCTKVNILLDLNRSRLKLERLESLVLTLYSLCNSLSSDFNPVVEEQFNQLGMKLSQEIKIYQLLNHLIQLTSLEYDKEYESTIYKKMVDCIFSSIKKNYFSKSITVDVLTDTKNFLSTLTEKEHGELIIEHFTINYSRNQGVFFSSFSSSCGKEFHKLESTIFGIILQSLGEEFRSFSLEEKIKKLESIYQTDFYKKYFSSSTFGTK